jgi:putative aminopeptidase FrvX
MMDSCELLERLSNLPGVAGFEGPVREALRGLVEPFVDEVRVDTLGNLIAVRRGRSAFKLMLDAHMDEIGFMVQHIDDRGFIGFTPLGGWDPRLLPSHLLTVVNRDGKPVQGVVGTHPPHIQKGTERDKVVPFDEMFLDVGASSGDEVREMGIGIGDPVVVHYPFRRLGKDTVAGKALDDRAGCAAVMKALEALGREDLEATIVAAFVVVEERGLIGARTAAFQIEPDMAVVVEGTVAADVPGVPAPRQPSGQGKGPAITVADGNFIVPRNMVRALTGVAEREGIPYQFKLPPSGGTDAGAIHQSRGGVLTGVLSVPCRYIHSPFSTCRLSDFDNTWRLLAAFCRSAPGLSP